VLYCEKIRREYGQARSIVFRHYAFSFLGCWSLKGGRDRKNSNINFINRFPASWDNLRRIYFGSLRQIGGKMELIAFVEKTGVIKFDNTELKTELKNALEKYRNLVYTDETIKEAKSDRAKLNNLTKAIEEKRKEIKRLYVEPLDDFEKKIKELTALIAAPCAEIDGQVKRFEESQKDGKRKELLDFADLEANSLIPYKDKFLFASFVTDKMLNASVKIKKSKVECADAVKKAKEGIDLIQTFPEHRQAGLMLSFSVSRDLAAVIRRNQELDEMEKIQAKQKEQAQLEKIGVKEEIKKVEATQESSDEMTYTLKLTGSKAALVELRKYIIAAGIKYEKVE